MAVIPTKPPIMIGNFFPPQYWDEAADNWVLISGTDGSYNVKTPNQVASKPFTGSATLTKEFSRAMTGFLISNDGTADLTFTINDGDAAGETYTVYAGAVWDEILPPFTSVTINTTVAYQAWGRYALGSTATIPAPPDTTPPDNVTGVTTSAMTSSTLTLSWNASASSDVAGYDIYRGATKLTTVTGLSYGVTGLSPNTQYTFTVKAKDGAGNVASGSGAAVTITTPADADTTPPGNVTGLNKSNITATGVTLSWAAPAEAASYDIYNGATFVANVATTNYNVTGLTALTAYTFTVKAKDAVGNAASGAQIDVTTIAGADTTAPANVASVSTSNVTATGVTLTWPASSSGDVSGYDVYNGSTFITTVTAPTVTYNVTGLTASTQYTFTIKARDAAGNVATGTSAAPVTTSAAADTTAPTAVTGFTAGTATSTTVPVTWTPSVSGDVTAQEAAYSTDGTNFTVASALINPSSGAYTFTGLTAATAYTFRLVAIDGAGNRSTAATTTKTTAADAIQLSNLTTPVLSSATGYELHPDYHNGAVKVRVNATDNKFFMAVRNEANLKIGVWCDGTNIKTGWVDNGVIRTEYSSQAKPAGDFYVEILIPSKLTPGAADFLGGYVRGYVWAASGSKPGSINISGKIEAPTTKWAATTAKSLNNLIVPNTANGYYYKCTTAGTTAAAEPTWPTTEGGTVTDGTAVWTCIKITIDVPTPAVHLYSLDGTKVNIMETVVGDGLTATHPLRGKINFVGRWYNTITASNTGNPYGDEMGTPMFGSEMLFEVQNTTSVNLVWANSVQFYVAVSIDGAALTRLPIVNATASTGASYPTGTVPLATGLTTAKHTVRVVIAAMATGTDVWNGTNIVRIKDITGDDGTLVVTPYYPPTKKKILYIGDSITEGISVKSATGGGGDGIENHAGELTYAKVSADLLNAVAYQHGYGGTGITKSSLGVPKAIDSTKSWYNTKKENLVEPDYIVIAHHSNDGAATDQAFIDGYKELLDWLIAKWGQKDIFLLEVSGIGKRLLLPTIVTQYANPRVRFIGTLQEGVTISAPVDTIHPDATGHTQIGTHLATRMAAIISPAFAGFTDDFNRADADLLGNGWSSANLGVLSNQAYNLNTKIGGVTTSNYISVRDFSVANQITISADLAAGTTNINYMNGIVFRYTDANNYWAFGKLRDNTSGIDGWTVVKVIAGATTRYPVYAPTITYPCTLKVELRGDLIYCYVGATLHFTIKDAALQTQTKHGIALGGSNAFRLDNFVVADVTGVTAPALDTTAPDVPGSLVVNTVTASSAKLYWNKVASADAMFYDIFANGVLNQRVVMDNSIGAGTQVNVVVAGLTHGTAYTLEIQSVDGSGNASAKASIATKTAPAAVTNLAASSLTSTSLTLTWTASASASANAYRVTQNTTRLTNPDLAGNVFTYNVTGLTAATSYTFKVGAIDTVTGLMTETSIPVTTP